MSQSAETKEHAAGPASPHLDDSERDQASAHSSPRALVIHEIIREEGETALARRPLALLWSALAAGLSMGFSFYTQATLKSKLSALPEDTGSLLAALGYCVGFIIVMLGRQQLFTESTLTVVLPVLTHRNLKTLMAALRLWLIVLVANIAGTWIFAGLLSFPISAELTASLQKIASASIEATFAATTLKAVFAGWLVALTVWLLPNSRSASVLIVGVITYVVGACQLAHVIAGSVEAAYLVIGGSAAFSDYLLRFFAPTLLGNTVGGMALVGLLNHASIAPEMKGGG